MRTAGRDDKIRLTLNINLAIYCHNSEKIQKMQAKWEMKRAKKDGPVNIYLLKVNNKNIRETSVTSFWCFYC